MFGLKQLFVHSKSAIQSAIIPGNENAISIAKNFKFDVKAILSPAVPRTGTTSFCLHSFNSPEEISSIAIVGCFIFFQDLRDSTD
jgi:8-amino-7-oxononanoate synthase